MEKKRAVIVGLSRFDSNGNEMVSKNSGCSKSKEKLQCSTEVGGGGGGGEIWVDTKKIKQKKLKKYKT